MEKELNITDLLQSIRELRISQEKTDKQIEKTDKQIEKTDKQVRALTKDIFGISTSMGLEAEELFRNVVFENRE
ncbi:hypothetical protein MNB_SUP05-SYMBIONT-5-1124 [hydrothermal vent metagenome]|uniref:Uncharacterized protein n=1 Tax=hydrothermal vent metagenome TaxID=652676 RepID=A0A1W1E5W2_9ZZZZ